MERHDHDLRVLLITESTYPFNVGGVSTWCNNLVNGLPNVDFEILAIVGSPDLVPLFELPKNVSAVTTVPVWGVRDSLELSDTVGFRDLARAGRSADQQTLANGLIAPLDALVRALFAESADPLALAEHVRALYGFFLVHDFDTAMRSPEVWEAFVAAAEESFDTAARGAGYSDVPFGLSDAMTGLHWLHHWLLPLSRRLPEADVAHAAMAGASVLPAVAMKLQDGTGFVFSEHGVYLREVYLREAPGTGSLFLKLLTIGFARRTSELAYAIADQISTCCEYNKRWAHRNGAVPGRVQTVHYGLDAAAFRAGPTPSGPAPVIAWVGRIDPLKDVETLLRAAAIVHRTRADVRFRLYGSASPERHDYEAHLLALHDELNLQDIVEMRGYTSDPQAAYDDADVVVLTSISEGFPYVTLEAMQCGKPVVATAVGGVPEQLGDCGVLVEPQDPEALAAALVGLLDDPEERQRLGAGAAERVRELFRLEDKNRMHFDSYVAARAGSPPVRAVAVAHQMVPEITGEGGVALLDAVREQVSHPVDEREIAAVLETSGVTDAVAQARYGAGDAFALASAIFSQLRGGEVGAGLRPHRIVPPDPERESITRAVSGALMLVPAGVLLGLGHWIGPIHGWTSGAGRALLLGVVASTLLGNAFLFAIMRRGALLLGCDRWNAARRFLLLSSVIAVVLLLCADAVALLVASAVGHLTGAEAATFGLSFAALIGLWVLTGGLVLVRRGYEVGLATLAGVAVGVVIYYALGTRSTTDVELALCIGYLVTIVVLATRATVVFGRPHRNGDVPRLPRVHYLLSEAAPFSAYGALVIALILGPNLASALRDGAAGSAGSGGSSDLRSVAVGMTLALVPLLLTIPAAEGAVRALWARVFAVLSELSIGESDGRLGQLLRAARRQRFAQYLALLAVLSLVAVPALWGLASAGTLSGLGVHSKGALMLGFAISLIGYLFVARAQLDLSPVVTFDRPDIALRCVLAGIAAAVVVAVITFALGFLQAGPVALVAGGAVFAGCADRASDRFFNEITLHYVGAM
jgi:polysaccharide biosynthesis protein PelF